MSANTTARRPDAPSGARAAVPDRRKQYRRRARIADILVTSLWASGAAAAALFLATGGSARFGTVADAVTSIGIVTGLIGTDFILVMIVLAARIPIIDRTVGHDRAIAVHRSLGKPALYLLLAHGALLLVGYGMSSGINPIAEIGPMLAIPDMLLAFIGLGLLVVVVITSLVAVRRKFSYEGWHIVHLLSYVAVLVAVPHQLSVGGILSAGSVERVYWIAQPWAKFAIQAARNPRSRNTSRNGMLAEAPVSVGAATERGRRSRMPMMPATARVPA